MKKIIIGAILMFVMSVIGIEKASCVEIDVSKFNVELKTTPDSKTREKKCLNGEWDFYPVSNVKWYNPPEKLPDENTTWEKILVPSDWKSSPGSNNWYHSTRYFDYPQRWVNCPAGWYKKEIEVPKEMKNKRVILDFKRVDHYCWMYVNGKLAGEHEDSVVPFKIDITDAVKFGDKNVVQIYVIDDSLALDEQMKNKQDAYWNHRFKRPIFFRLGSTPWSGIWDDVYLIYSSEIYSDDVYITTSYREKNIKVKFNIVNNTNNNKIDRIKITVLEKENKEVLRIADTTVGVSIGEQEYVMKWENPKLWSTETPNLYYLKIELYDGKKLIDEKYERFGFREFWCEGKNFMLNGKKVYLYGEISHYFYADVFPRPEAFRSYIKLKKSFNENCVRELTSGGYSIESQYDVADEEGFMIIPHLECESHDPSILEDVKKIIKKRVLSKRNHPSIVILSIENEQFEMQRDQLKELAKLVMETDPSRLATADAGGDYDGLLPIINWHYPSEDSALGQLINIPANWVKNIKKPIYLGEHLFLNRYTERIDGQGRWMDDYTLYTRYDLWPAVYHEIYSSITKVWRSYGISMVLFGGSGDHFSLITGWKQTKLKWGDLTTPHIKMNYMFATFNPGYILDEPVVKFDKRFQDVYKEIIAPVAVSIWRDWKHNFIAGENIDKSIWVFNHTLEDKNNLKVKYRLEPTNIQKEINVQIIPQGETIEAGKISLVAPSVNERTEYKLKTELINNKGEIINTDWMLIHVYPKPKLNATLVNSKKILLYDIKGQTEKMMMKAGIKYTKYEIGKTELDDKIDLMVIGKDSVDSDLEDELEKIDDYIKNGGKVIIFEQPTVNRTDRSTGFITAPGHPIFKGISQDRIYLLNEPGNLFYSLVKIPSTSRYKSLVSIGGKNYQGGALFEAGRYSVLMEKKNGNGTVVSCYLQVTIKYGLDPEATIFVNNMFEYMLSLPNTKIKNIAYYGKDSENNVLQKTKSKYENIATLDKLNDFDILIIGETEINNESKIVAQGEQIRNFVKGGGTVLCMSQKAEDWTDKWLPEPIELKKHQGITRGICNASYLTYGTRRVLFDGQKWENNTAIFFNHFIAKENSKWTKIIESCSLKEQNEPPFRSVHLPNGGAIVVELKEGKGQYILCQIPDNKEQDAWINEAVIQLLTNIDVPRKEEESEKIKGNKVVVKPAEKKDWEGYVPIEITHYANMVFKDDVDGDKKGGWADQGPNDMRNLPVGDLIFRKTPFKIKDPYSSYLMEPERTCIVLRDGKFRPYFPKEAKGIVVADNLKELYFLHCSVWGNAEAGDIVGRYVVNYEDGTKEEIKLKYEENIMDWWSVTKKELSDAEIAWIGQSGAGNQVGLYKIKWINPKPDKKIKTIDVISNEKVILIVVAITGKL